MLQNVREKYLVDAVIRPRSGEFLEVDHLIWIKRREFVGVDPAG
jgi:hypothetical protein